MEVQVWHPALPAKYRNQTGEEQPDHSGIKRGLWLQAEGTEQVIYGKSYIIVVGF